MTPGRRRRPTSSDTDMATRISESVTASSRSCWKRDVHAERHGLGAARAVAGEDDRRAELPERARPAHAGAGDQRGETEWHHDPQKDQRLGRPQRRGGVAVPAIHRGEPGPGGVDEERRRHEHLRHDDGERGERQRDPEEGERPAGQPDAAEREQQHDAGHCRGEHHRQVDQHLQRRLPRKGLRRGGRPPGRPSATTATAAAVLVSRLRRRASRTAGSPSRVEQSGGLDAEQEREQRQAEQYEQRAAGERPRQVEHDAYRRAGVSGARQARPSRSARPPVSAHTFGTPCPSGPRTRPTKSPRLTARSRP